MEMESSVKSDDDHPLIIVDYKPLLCLCWPRDWTCYRSYGWNSIDRRTTRDCLIRKNENREIITSTTSSLHCFISHFNYLIPYIRRGKERKTPSQIANCQLQSLTDRRPWTWSYSTKPLSQT